MALAFEVDDETKAQYGDMVAKVSGDSNANVTELTVGTYGDYDATVSAESPDTAG